MAPYLLFGFIIAGLLHVYMPGALLRRWLGKGNFKSVLYASLIGVPLPLCSCGVIPTGISLHKEGASNGATVSFLISTPQTGVDSILVTYSLLGLPMAIIRPCIALITGVFGGWLTNLFVQGKGQSILNESSLNAATNRQVTDVFKYAFGDFMEEIADWLIIGLVLAALIAILIPETFFQSAIFSNSFLSMLVILAASVPFYVCASGSVPIAAALLMKGLDPGSVLVFLMAGPATNIASITVISRNLGIRVGMVYLLSIIAGALFFGFIINNFVPREFFIVTKGGSSDHLHHQINWIGWSSTVILILLLARIYVARLRRIFKGFRKTNEMSEVKIRLEVEGMTCNNCASKVERALHKIDSVRESHADYASNTVEISGSGIDMKDVESTIAGAGYKMKRILS